MMSTVGDSGVISTFEGFLKIVLASLTISGGIVAEKKSDCRFPGSTAINFFTSWMKPISSMRSASSRTNISMSLNKI